MIALAVDWIRRWRAPRPDHDVDQAPASAFGIPLQLYVVALLAVPLLPRGVYISHTVPIALLTDRLTSVSAILVCCLLGAMRSEPVAPRSRRDHRRHFLRVRLSGHGGANRMEAQAERLVRTLPKNSRVMATIDPPTSRASSSST